MRVVPVLAALLLAGCAEGTYDPRPDGGVGATQPVSLHGSFTNDRTQEDIDAWCDLARRYGNDCALMESYPEQFRLGFSTSEECERARAELAGMPRVRPGACTLREGTA